MGLPPLPKLLQALNALGYYRGGQRLCASEVVQLKHISSFASMPSSSFVLEEWSTLTHDHIVPMKLLSFYLDSDTASRLQAGATVAHEDDNARFSYSWYFPILSGDSSCVNLLPPGNDLCAFSRWLDMTPTDELSFPLLRRLPQGVEHPTKVSSHCVIPQRLMSRKHNRKWWADASFSPS